MSNRSCPEVPAAVPETLPPGGLRVIGLLVVSAFVLILNETTMGVALKPIMDQLGIDELAGQWLTTAFLLTMAVVIPITGYLLQRFDTRPIFLTSLGLFTTGTLIAALSPGFEVLVLARIVQASGTAIMMPLLMTTVMALVPESRRGQMMGNVSLVIAVAPAVGPTLSGFLLAHVNWRGIFWTMLPLAAVMLISGAIWVRNVGDPKPVRLDIFSVIMSAIGFGGVVYGLSQIAAHASVLLPLLVGGIALIVFVWRQLVLQRTGLPLLDLRTLLHGRFTISLVMLMCLFGAMLGVMLVLPLFLQRVHGMDPLDVGLLLLPGGVLMGLAARPVGAMFDKVGPRPLVIPGTVIASAVMWGYTQIGLGTPPWLLMVGHLVMCGGLALVFTPLFTIGLGSVDPHQVPFASALFGSLQQVGGAAGTALLVTMMALGSGGSLEGSAQVTGLHWAMGCAGVVSLVPILGALWLRGHESGDDTLIAHH